MNPPVASKHILHISPIPSHPQLADNRARVRRLAGDLRALGHELHLLFIRNVPGDLDAMRTWLDGRLHVVENPRRSLRNPLRFRALNLFTAGRVMGPSFEYVAARGIREGAGRAFLLASSARRCARAISSLLDDRSLAERFADQAHRFAGAYDARALATLRTLLDAR